MTDNEMDSGFEWVLDNRRLIAAFSILIIICGGFFVWGYWMGKRQGEIAASGSLRAGEPGREDRDLSTSEGPVAEIQPIEEDEAREDLGWYKSVNDSEMDTPGIEPSRTEVKRTPPETGTSPSAGAVQNTYSVQVGAFKTRKQAETVAEDIRAKGFQSRIEAPPSPNGLYRVKVGRYNTRPEAMADQLSLKKKGYSECYIKIN